MSCVKSTMNNPGNDYSEAETSALGGEDVSMCHSVQVGTSFLISSTWRNGYI